MKIRNARGRDKVELLMTPMIDVVFLLLVFFLLTFRIVSLEGDFDIKMPRAAGPVDHTMQPIVPTLVVRLEADARGNVSTIALNDTQFTSYEALRNHIIGMLGTDAAMQESTEVEFDCDYHLRYEETVRAVTAVSGYVGDDGKPVKLVDKIRFKPAAEPND
jgi:biopolymer transport protein ExbD